MGEIAPKDDDDQGLAAGVGRGNPHRAQDAADILHVVPGAGPVAWRFRVKYRPAFVLIFDDERDMLSVCGPTDDPNARVPG